MKSLRSLDHRMWTFLRLRHTFANSKSTERLGDLCDSQEHSIPLRDAAAQSMVDGQFLEELNATETPQELLQLVAHRHPGFGPFFTPSKTNHQNFQNWPFLGVVLAPQGQLATGWVPWGLSEILDVSASESRKNLTVECFQVQTIQ